MTDHSIKFGKKNTHEKTLPLWFGLGHKLLVVIYDGRNEGWGVPGRRREGWVVNWVSVSSQGKTVQTPLPPCDIRNAIWTYTPHHNPLLPTKRGNPISTKVKAEAVKLRRRRVWFVTEEYTTQARLRVDIVVGHFGGCWGTTEYVFLFSSLLHADTLPPFSALFCLSRLAILSNCFCVLGLLYRLYFHYRQLNPSNY